MVEPYATKDDLESVFGAANIRDWADRDRDGNPIKIQANIEKALKEGAQRINDRFRKSKYVVPLASVDNDADDLLVIKGVNARLSGWILWESKRVEDVPSLPKDYWRKQRTTAEKDINDYLSGALNLNCTLKSAMLSRDDLPEAF